MMKLLVNQSLYAQGLHTTQVLGTVFDGIARHTEEGYAFQRRAAEAGFREAVRERDEPVRRPRLLDLQRLSPLHGEAGPDRRAAGPAGSAPVRRWTDHRWRGLEWRRLADVAQLARASPCHGEGRGFESLHPLLRKPCDCGVFLVLEHQTVLL